MEGGIFGESSPTRKEALSFLARGLKLNADRTRYVCLTEREGQAERIAAELKELLPDISVAEFSFQASIKYNDAFDNLQDRCAGLGWEEEESVKNILILKDFPKDRNELRRTFYQLNAKRNNIVQLPSSLIFIINKEQVQAFAMDAPDFWSVLPLITGFDNEL